MKLSNKYISTFIFASMIGYCQSQEEEISAENTNKVDVRFNKFNPLPGSDILEKINLPLTEKNYPIGKKSKYVKNIKEKTDAITVVNHKDDFEIQQFSIKDLINSVGGEPDHPSVFKNAEYWDKLYKLIELREISDNALAVTALADFMQQPLRWQNYTVYDIGEAVHDEYPGLHQAGFIEDLVANGKYGPIEFDDDIIPRRSTAQFLRGIVMLCDLNTWTVSNVGPYNFGAKWYAGRARPEEVAFQIANGEIKKKYVPKKLFNAIAAMNLETVTDFSQYPEGSPRHPSWPAMHSAASNISFWLQVVMRLTPRQVCEAKKVDFAVAYARSVAGVHFEDDNIAGLMMGQTIVAGLLPEYLEMRYNSPKLVVEDKISKKTFDWLEYDPLEKCEDL